jgi:hypothetical protein
VDTLLGICQAFELDRGMVPQTGVQALGVVEAIDVAAEHGIGLGVNRELALDVRSRVNPNRDGDGVPQDSTRLNHFRRLIETLRTTAAAANGMLVAESHGEGSSQCL